MAPIFTSYEQSDHDWQQLSKSRRHCLETDIENTVRYFSLRMDELLSHVFLEQVNGRGLVK